MRLGAVGAGLLLLLPLTAQQPDTPAAPKPTVVFHRGDTNERKLAVGRGGSDSSIKSEITDGDRRAVTFTRYALDVRLQPNEHAVAVRAQLTVRNDGDHALRQVPLQISSSMHWEDVRVGGVRNRFVERQVESDADHTGTLSEAAVLLAVPLAPGAEVRLDVIYSGTVAKSAMRLQAIGTPADLAEQTDWDEVSAGFVGIRGFGNVAWYPVAAPLVKLGDGDKLFAEIGRVKQRQSGAIVTMKVTAEAKADEDGHLSVPSVAVLNGTVVPVTVAAGTEQAGVPSLAICSLPEESLGFQTMSLVLAERHRLAGHGGEVSLNIYAKPEGEAPAQAYLSAAELAGPLLRSWLGEGRGSASIIELPAAEDAPFEARASLYAGLQAAPAAKLAVPVTHWLTHAQFRSPRVWLDEGVAQFMTGVATEQTISREAALDQLDAQRGALALAEPSEGTVRDGLLTASDAIFYRTKATYVLWMLRSMLGDEAMQAVLKAYEPAMDTTDDYFEDLVKRIAADPKYADRKTGQASGDMQKMGGAEQPRDLHWFFEDWVYRDKGLPELSITSVVPSKASTPNSYLVAVNVANSGGAGAEVPVTVTSGTTQVTERILIPAHGTAVRRILIQDEPVQVQLNDGVVPEVGASVHQERVRYAP